MTDGEYIEYYESGEIFSKIIYLDDKLHGESINYFMSGLISSKCNFIYGEFNGECIYYFLSGELNYKSYYIYDKAVTELEWISYNRNIKLELLGL